MYPTQSDHLQEKPTDQQGSRGKVSRPAVQPAKHHQQANAALPPDRLAEQTQEKPTDQQGRKPPQPQTRDKALIFPHGDPSKTRLEEQQKKQDDYQKRMEQLQTNRFIQGLRRAVDKHLRNMGSVTQLAQSTKLRLQPNNQRACPPSPTI